MLNQIYGNLVKSVANKKKVSLEKSNLNKDWTCKKKKLVHAAQYQQ